MNLEIFEACYWVILGLVFLTGGAFVARDLVRLWRNT